MLEFLDHIDRSLFLFLNELGHPHLDFIMWWSSEKLTWIPVYLFLLFLIGKKYNWKVALISLLGIALVVTLADQSSVKLFKNVFERFRPSHNPEIADLVQLCTRPNGEIYKGGLYGFVSSHAANFFGIATFVIAVLNPSKKLRILIYLWVAFISYTRIYLGVHYPGDILGGAILGFICAKVAYFIWVKALKKLSPANYQILKSEQ